MLSRLLCLCFLVVVAYGQASKSASSLAQVARTGDASALAELITLANNGDSEAQTDLGTMYAMGEGVPRDPVKAASWLRKAAERGVRSAQYNLGILYQRGEGVSKSLDEAVHWWRRSADQGYALAELALGVSFVTGVGLPKDSAQGAIWLNKAAEHGVDRAQLLLGFMYEKGDGVDQDASQAVFWYRKAAEQGLAEAQFDLGVMYSKGNGVSRDAVQASLWHRKAADQGFAGAQYNLAIMYEDGAGVLKDYAQAVIWYRKAAAQGHSQAQVNLRNMYLVADAPVSDSADVISSLEPEQAKVRLADLHSQRELILAEIKKIQTDKPQIAPKGMFETTEEYKARGDKAEERVRESIKPLQESVGLLERAIITLRKNFYINPYKASSFIGYDADSKEMRVSLDGSEFVSYIPRDVAQNMHQEWSEVLVAENGWSLGGDRVGSHFVKDASLIENAKVAVVWKSRLFVLEPAYRVYQVGGEVSAPTLLSKVEPEYSEKARRAKLQGSVVLHLEIDENGEPKKLRVVRALGLGLDEKAIEAVSKWRFRPGYKAGKPVPTAATLEVRFRL
jgi:TonB family protein